MEKELPNNTVRMIHGETATKSRCVKMIHGETATK